MKFDLAYHDFSKSADDGYSFNLTLPNGAETDAKLTVIGNLSEKVVNYNKAKMQKWQQQLVIARKKNKDIELPTQDEADEERIQDALVRLIDWSNIQDEGKEVKFSKEKAYEVLKKHDWLCKQIIEESDNVENFTPKQSKG